MVSLDGILTYRARSDGSPYAVINQAGGTYTELPAEGRKVDCGDVLYGVDDDPVLLLCGTVRAYRDLDLGDTGNDVRQLNRILRELGYDGLNGDDFTSSRVSRGHVRAPRGRMVPDGCDAYRAEEQCTTTRACPPTGRLGVR